MCLAIPGQVVELVDATNGQLALVDVAGARRNINVGMLEDDEQVVAGDWILIHMGFAPRASTRRRPIRRWPGSRCWARPAWTSSPPHICGSHVSTLTEEN